jgi:hypothetical protein
LAEIEFSVLRSVLVFREARSCHRYEFPGFAGIPARLFRRVVLFCGVSPSAVIARAEAASKPRGQQGSGPQQLASGCAHHGHCRALSKSAQARPARRFCLKSARKAGESAACLRTSSESPVRGDELGDDVGRFVAFMSAAEPAPRYENVAIVVSYRARREWHGCFLVIALAPQRFIPDRRVWG